MPPEPLPWDRNKNRSDTLRSVARWRESRSDFTRWGGVDDFRRPPQGHGKQQQLQGGAYPDDSAGAHGYTPHHFRDNNRMVDNSSSSFRPRPSIRCARNAKGSLAPRQHDLNSQRSVSDLLSHPQSDIDNSWSWDQHHFKDKLPTPNPIRYYDKEQSSLAWKSLKWNRPTSLSSHTTSSRTMGVDSDETKPDAPAQSPSSHAASLNGPFEDLYPRKKPRLGWGQGLAKYEKQKVEGSDETLSKNGFIPAATIPTPPESIPTFTEKSPRVTGPSECASPVTTFSVACSSSPGVDDKTHIKEANDDIDTYYSSRSPAHGFQSCLEEFSANLEHLNSAPNLSSLLKYLLQLEDASSGDSNFVKSTVMHKLLLVKGELSKALEKTECEIDMFENEMKSLISDFESNGPRSVASDSLQQEGTLRPCENLCSFSKAFQKPAPLLVSCIGIHVDTPTLCNEALEGVHGEVKEDDIDSPGTATSKFVEPLCMEKAVSAYSIGTHDGRSTDVVVARSAPSEKPWLSPSAYDEKSASESSGVDRKQQTESSFSTHTLTDLHSKCNLNDLILDSNRDSARKAFEVFSKLLPADQSAIDMWSSSSYSCQKYNSDLKQKLASKKCFQRFKERVLSLKFRALQHLWKEDIRLLSVRKCKPKSQKRIESNMRTPHIVYQKHRSSIRSRFTSPAGSLTLVPASEIVDFTSKLLSDSQIKLYRNNLKMPALVDQREKQISRFVSSNGLVEDPCAVEKERVMVNPWTAKEKEVFLEYLATFGKDFKRIASYLDHKTTADCVEFYYKNHKSECFEKIKKTSDLKKQERGFQANTYLMTSGKKWNREVNAASLDLLGEASVMAAHADNNLKSQHSKSFLGGHYYQKTCWGDDASYEKSSSVDIFGNEREATAADTLAGICGALSSEAMSSCVTSSVDPGESCQEGKFQKNFVMDQPLATKCMQIIDDEETCSDECCGELDCVDWTDDEKSNFIGALSCYGKDFVKIARCVRSKSRDQCKVFFSKARKSLGLDVIHHRNSREGTPTSDANGGRSDTEDACVLEMESAICSTQSCSKVESDHLLSVNCEASDHATTSHLQSDEVDILGENHGMERLNHLQTDAPERSGENNGTELLCSAEEVVVGEHFILKCEPDQKPKVDICDEDNTVKGASEKLDGPPEIMQLDNVSEVDSALTCVLSVMPHLDAGFTHLNQGVRRQQIKIPVKESFSAEVPSEVAYSMACDMFENKAMAAASTESLVTVAGPEKIMLPEGGDDHIQNIMTGVDSNIRSSSGCVGLVSNININSYCKVVDTNFCQNFSLNQNHQPQISSDLLHSVQKAQIISWKQKESTPVSANSASTCSSRINYEDHLLQGSSSSTLNFHGTRNEQLPKPATADVPQRYLLCNQSMNQDESSHILRGYPLKVLSKKDVNGHADCSSSETIVHNPMPNEYFQSAQFSVQDFHREHCNGSELPQSLTELPLLTQDHEQSAICHVRSNSLGSDAEDSQRIGDVKLFGQILSHPSISHKPGIMTRETDDRGASLPKASSRIFNMKFTDQAVDRALLIPKLDANKYSGLDDFPVRSYGFWDGSRIQTGLSSLPDTSILLAKYPAAFNDYSAAAGKRNLSSISTYPAKDVSSSISLPDYQVYRDYDVAPAKVAPFTVDAFSDVQKQNGYEMSRGGGGGVSDPVAAMKMHYAAAGGLNGNNNIREEESWRR